jgi:glycerol-3-phosphate dehydrogenase
MHRDVGVLNTKAYDLIVVGGGIFGICAAWDAALRGLSVALLERADFAHATSANCFRIVHGGIRYLQHGDLYRIRESSRERNALLRIAPHLVHPLPIVVPTYGHGLASREFLCAGLWTYDLLTFDRNHGITDPQKRIPAGHAISRQECLRLFPGLESNGLTGAVILYDAQMYSPARLALSFLRSAVRAGADAVNYTEVTRFLRSGDRVCGVRAKDTLTGDELEVRGRVVLNAAGPWAEHVLKLGLGLQLRSPLTYSRDACLVATRSCPHPYALAVPGSTKDPDAVLSRGRRHLFVVPWHDCSLIGVWHKVHTGEPDSFTVTAEEAQRFLDEVNASYPGLGLTLKDVSLWNAGLVLFGQKQTGSEDLSYGKRSELLDHANVHGIDGLVTMVGVRYTTARGVAEAAVNQVFRKLGRRPPGQRTSTTPLYGGGVDRFADFVESAIRQRPPAVRPETVRALTHQHGTEYHQVLRHIDADPTAAETFPGSAVIKAEVVHAVRHEMAQKLGDVLFRRTNLGAAGHPGEPALKTCADLMASMLGWAPERIQNELDEVQAVFPSWHAA